MLFFTSFLLQPSSCVFIFHLTCPFDFHSSRASYLKNLSDSFVGVFKLSACFVTKYLSIFFLRCKSKFPVKRICFPSGKQKETESFWLWFLIWIFPTSVLALLFKPCIFYIFFILLIFTCWSPLKFLFVFFDFVPFWTSPYSSFLPPMVKSRGFVLNKTKVT